MSQNRKPRVVIYGVGQYGSHIARFALQKGWPIVAAFNRAGAKVGQDLGRVIGLERDLGVIIQDCETGNYHQLDADIGIVAQTNTLRLNLPAYRRLLNAGLNVGCHGSESYLPYGCDPQSAAEIDELAKKNGVTFTGSGIWDMSRIWSGILLAGPCTEITALTHSSITDAQGQANSLQQAKQVGIGGTVDQFYAMKLDQSPLPVSYKTIPEHVLIALGYTITETQAKVEPVVFDVPVPTRYVPEGSFAAGTVVGARVIADIHTREGVTATARIDLRMFKPGEVEHMFWEVEGKPRTRVRVERDDSAHATAANLFNRIPDIIAASPGIQPVYRLGPSQALGVRLMNFQSRFDDFHNQAVQATGLSDFGSTDYVEPMKLLLASYDQHCRFTPEGEGMAAGGVVGMLIARLFAEQGFKAFPDLDSATIPAPIIITGMPRTGSTTLQKLLACDPDTQSLVPWLGAAPQPRPPRETWASHPILQATEQGIEQLYQIVPEVRSMHPMVADQADECRVGMGSTFWRPDLAFTGPIVGPYAEWITASVPCDAYRYYRKVLALIGRGDHRRWLLKDPTTHPFAARTMLETFPDARIVWTHRDPVSAMSSVSDMMYWARRWYVDGLTMEENGREQIAFWTPAIEQLSQALSALPPSQIVHVHMKELHVDPAATAERIYRHFDIPVTAAAQSAWKAYVAKDPRGGHGTHVHEAGNCGFSPTDVQVRMPSYCASYRSLFQTEG